MTTATASYQKGLSTLPPEEVHDLFRVEPREVSGLIFDDDEIVIEAPLPEGAEGLVDILLACPYPFEIPPRSRELPPPVLEM